MLRRLVRRNGPHARVPRRALARANAGASADSATSAALLLALGCWTGVTLIVPAPAAAAAAADIAVAATADTEGHVGPCQTCPHHPGRGGLARRATAVAQLRAAHPGGVLLVDAGSAVIGEESLPSRGAVVVDAYSRMGYDAINLTTSDLLFGRDHALPLMTATPVVLVSCNILDDETGQPAAPPYAVKLVGGRKVAIVGACEPPAGLDALPHLRRPLAGLRFRPPAEALAEWLPVAKANADAVVLLYHGTPAGIRAIHRQFAGEVAVVCAGGARPGRVKPDAPDGPAAPLLLVAEHGKQLAVATLADGAATATAAAAVDVTESLEPDAALTAILALYRDGLPVSSAASPAPAVPAGPAPASDATATATPGSADPPPGEDGQRRLRPLQPPPTLTLTPPADPDPAQAMAPAEAKPRALVAPPTVEPAPAPEADPPAAAEASARSQPPPPQYPQPPPAAPEPETPPEDAHVTEAAKPPSVSPPPPPSTAPAPVLAPAPAPEAPSPKFCTACGARLQGTKFCTACGAAVRR